MTENPRPFVIPLRRRWGLLILPVLCLLYFAAVVALVVMDLAVTGVPTRWLVMGGAALFLVTIVVEVPFFLRRRPRRAKAEEPDYVADLQDEPPEPDAPLAPRVKADDELVITSEQQQGLRVIEYSKPAKSRHRGAVFAKTYVPVTKEHVLRVETLAAEGRDL